MSLNAQLKNLTRHSFVYTLSTLIQRTLGFIMLPVYTSISYMSTGSYGDYSLIYTFIAFMNIAYLYGMDSAFMRYYFLGQHSRKDIYTTAFWAVGLNALFLSAVIYILAGSLGELIFQQSGYEFFVRISAIILALDTFSNLPYLILRAEERSIAYTSIRVARFICELVLNIVFVVVLKLGVKGILYANVVASFLNILFLIPAQKPYLSGVFNKQAFKEMLFFGIPMLPNGVAYLIVEISDKYLMNVLLDKDTLAIYSASYKFGTVLLLLVTAFRTAWQPFFLKIVKNPDHKRVYSFVLTYFVLGSVVLVHVGGYLIEYIVKIPLPGGHTLMGKAYWGGTSIIPIILTSYLFFGMYVNFTVGVYIKKRTRLMFLFTGLAAIVNVGSNLYLMPHFGIMGAAVATLLAYLVMAVSLFWANQLIYAVPYDYKRLTILFVYLFVVLTLYYGFNPTWQMRLLSFLLAPLFLFITGFFNRNEIQVMKDLVMRFKKA